MQVAGLVTVPGGSWGGEHILLKLSGVTVQVARLGGSSHGDQFLWKLQGIVVQVAGLVMYLEEVGVVTIPGLTSAASAS